MQYRDWSQIGGSRSSSQLRVKLDGFGVTFIHVCLVYTYYLWGGLLEHNVLSILMRPSSTSHTYGGSESASGFVMD